MRIIAAAACLMLLTAGRAAQPAPADPPSRGDFRAGIPITVKGSEGLFAASLPLAVYAGSERRDLGDLRVFNSAGEIVPYSLLSPAATATEKSAPAKAPIFPLWARQGTEAGAISVRIEQGDKGAIVGVHGAEKSAKQARLAGYIVDVSGVKKPLQALVIDWRQPQNKDDAQDKNAKGFSGEVDVESSDDFAHWTNRVNAAPLLMLQHEGESLNLNRVELPRVAAKYLRLSWPAAQITPDFTQVRVEAVDTAVETPRVWATASGQSGAKTGEYAFDLGAHAPFDRLRISLPNANTVANLQLLAREKADDPWRSMMFATVYRLTRAGKDFLNPDLDIGTSPERYWLLRADQRTPIGAGAPKLSAGFIPQKIVFAARGSGPFTLAYGAAGVASAAIPISTLVPGYNDEQPLQAESAVFGEPQAQTGARPSTATWLDWRAYDWKRIALWSVLALGVVLLGWMALRLGNEIKPKN
jgi:hypothetical protein